MSTDRSSTGKQWEPPPPNRTVKRINTCSDLFRCHITLTISISARLFFFNLIKRKIKAENKQLKQMSFERCGHLRRKSSCSRNRNYGFQECRVNWLIINPSPSWFSNFQDVCICVHLLVCVYIFHLTFIVTWLHICIYMNINMYTSVCYRKFCLLKHIEEHYKYMWCIYVRCGIVYV